LPAFLLQARDSAGDRYKMLDVELTVSRRHNASAQLDYRAARCPQPLLLFAFQWMTFCSEYFITSSRNCDPSIGFDCGLRFLSAAGRSNQ
jgi:hypothetical protein